MKKFLNDIAKEIRKDIIRITYNCRGGGGAHIGGSLSLCEIMAVLYNDVMKYNPENPEWPERDRLILSKGHGAIAMYSALKNIGLLSEDEMMSYKHAGSFLTPHPSFMPSKGMEFASGSLGQGLSIGAGVATALRMKNSSARVFVILGDGECDEGQIWEAAMFSAHHKLSNLICIVDKNCLQIDGSTDEVLSLGDLAAKWRSFGWHAETINGHDVNELCAAFEYHDENKPYALICNTVKGKGVSFMENDYKYHQANLTEEQYIAAMNEQEASA